MTTQSKVILIFTVAILIGIGIVGLVVYQAKLARGLEIQITGPDKVTIGVPFDLKVGLSNSSNNELQQVRLSLNLPPGVAFLGTPPAKNVDFRDVSSLGVGGLSQQEFRLIALDGQNTFKQITASATYLSGSLSSRFEKSQDFQLAVGDYSIGLDIATPQQIFSGESFDAQITYKNNSDFDFDNLKLKIDYPPTYTLTKSTLKPDIGNNIWLLGGLHPRSDNNFKITGNVIGAEGSSFDLKTSVTAVFQGQEYPIAVNTATISLATSPLSIKIALNDNPEYVAKPGDPLNYVLTYTNNTDIGLRDVIIQTQLVGAMLDFSQLSSNGTFRSTDNTLIWNASNLPELGTVLPGQSGSVSFNLKVKNNYPIRRLSDKNFTLKARASIESPTVPSSVQATKTYSLATLETKVAGQTNIASKVYFRDATSGIVNKGPFPPKVNQPTQYTVHWQITNYGTDVNNVTVSAFLGGNVKFTGVAKASSGTSVPVYNDRTQQMTWTISRIPATAGVISAPLEAVFQIVATPSSSDLGTYMTLIQETPLKATDEFTNTDLTSRAAPVTTQLPDDTSVFATPGVVIK